MKPGDTKVAKEARETRGDKNARYTKDSKRSSDAADARLKRTVPGPLSKVCDI